MCAACRCDWSQAPLLLLAQPLHPQVPRPQDRRPGAGHGDREEREPAAVLPVGACRGTATFMGDVECEPAAVLPVGACRGTATFPGDVECGPAALLPVGACWGTLGSVGQLLWWAHAGWLPPSPACCSNVHPPTHLCCDLEIADRRCAGAGVQARSTAVACTHAHVHDHVRARALARTHTHAHTHAHTNTHTHTRTQCAGDAPERGRRGVPHSGAARVDDGGLHHGRRQVRALECCG